ncbi:hypothetical protein CCAX7_61020 [Capsulimonas corticalis]|uniref:Uncharacterized protein n=1 Tax=Capsulimonas corticalis TaxID=2219043 RepID=A0A402CW91_9BACT|nr:DUF1223 domain-containing protein [Capsulimonas corticalis]BDI34051.1 hypothetical protein CCAX7_61020 [Capsulimonas corticalis]
MRTQISAAQVRKCVCLAAVCLTAGSSVYPAQTQAASAPSGNPVIVELFTSEGCSSCPPADKVLSGLEREQPVRRAHIIVLGEHVDYWDHNGWKDRYSNYAFSVRQNGYAKQFHSDSVYTPQMVVDGDVEFVGSDRDKAIHAISRAAASPKATVRVTMSGAADAADIKANVDNLPDVGAGDTAQVIMAITEDNLQSSVAGGENEGRMLSHSAVVREMRLLGVAAAHPTAFSARIKLPAAWRRENLRVAVFVQEQSSRRILGAAETKLDPIRSN